MRRSLVTAATLAALAAPTNAFAGQAFLFDRTSAQPNDRVTIKATTAARAGFRLYLVQTDAAGPHAMRATPG